MGRRGRRLKVGKYKPKPRRVVRAEPPGVWGGYAIQRGPGAYVIPRNVELELQKALDRNDMRLFIGRRL